MVINLQLFADAGDLVNATGGYPNAYTGEVAAFDGKNTLSPGMKTFYDTELLENTRADVIFAQFGKKVPLPDNHGKTIEWRKFNEFEKASELQEAVIPTGQKFGQSFITGEVKQYGTYAAVSDELELRYYDNIIAGVLDEMHYSAVETQENIVRDELMTGTNVMYAVGKDESGAEVSTPFVRWELTSDAGKKCFLTPDIVAQTVTWLKKLKAPKINGKYVAIIHPSVAYDLRRSNEWIEVHKYSGTKELYNGEIGELHGVRFVETTEAPVLVGQNLGMKRRLTAASGWNVTSAETADVGIADTYNIIISEPATEDLLGREVLVSDSGDSTIHGHYVITGVNTGSKILFAASMDNAAASGDFLLPGEGGFESKTSGRNAVYATMFFGADAFGVIDPESGALQTIVKAKSEIGGPLDQFSTIGYKLTTGAKILYPSRIVRVESCSSYSGADSAN